MTNGGDGGDEGGVDNDGSVEGSGVDAPASVAARDPPRKLCPKARPISLGFASLDAATSVADNTGAGNESVVAGTRVLSAVVVPAPGDALVGSGGKVVAADGRSAMIELPCA